ncbi:MAG TPA: FecR domain-containing protein, partial [Polyangiaceae bacterium]
MTDLEPLSSALRRELGSPSVEWYERQRQRLLRAGALEASKPGRGRLARLPAAALALTALAVVTAGAVYFLRQHDTSAADPPESGSVWLSADAGRRFYRTADGSQISLSRGARGRLSFRAATSDFDLYQGTGLFDVKRQPGRAWSVVAGQYEVRVVGTRFSVHYEPPESLRVEVERGAVAVVSPSHEVPVRLQAGDRLTLEGERLVVEQHELKQAGVPAPRSSEPRETAEPQTPPHEAGEPSAPARGTHEPTWRTLYKKGEYRAALAAAQKLGFDGLLSGLDRAALTDLADAARLSGGTGPALRALRALEQRFPGSPAASEAGFLIGRIHAAQGNSGLAVERFENYFRRGPRARYSLEAMGRLIELYSSQGRTNEARNMAELYLKRAPNGPYQRLARSVLSR